MLRLNLLVLAAAITLLPILSAAQSIPVSSIPLSGTIATTNTFQSIQASSNNRIGCTIQNTASSASGDLMWVFVDRSNSASCSSATKAGAVILQPGQAIYCSVASNITIKDQVCITGTSGDTFFANFQ